MDLESILKTLSDSSINYKILSQGGYDGPVTNISINSKVTEEGNLFVALRGSSTDGHRYLKEALSKGARLFIVEALQKKAIDPEIIEKGSVIAVEDTHKALAVVSAAFYDFPTAKLHLTGVTGTNGKTTVTVLIESILQKAHNNAGRLGTIGYCWNGGLHSAPLTTPDALTLQKIFSEMVKGGVGHVVMEVSSHAIAQHRIFGCSYDAAVFTNLSQDHLDFHITMEGYFQTKKALFLDYLKGNKGCAVINIDDPYGVRLLEMIKDKPLVSSPRCITYGIHNKEALVKPLSLECSCRGIKTTIDTPRGPLEISSELLGKLNAYNILAAVGAGIAHSIDLKVIKNGIEVVSGVNGRLEKVKVETPFQVVVDYAHTPDAMDKTLSCLRSLAEGKLISVFGCGGNRDRTKRPLMAQAASHHCDVMIITSDNPRMESPEAIIEDIVKGVPKEWKRSEDLNDLTSSNRVFSVIVDRRKAIETALRVARKGDIVFIGGKGHETYQIIGKEKIPFDDRTVVREWFSCSI